MSDTEDLRDALPDDLNASEYVGPYQFPDNSRRRRPAYLYFGIAAVCLLLWLLRRGHDPVLVNSGMLWAAILLTAVGLLSFTSGWKMHVDEKQALGRRSGRCRVPGRARVGAAGVARAAQQADVASAGVFGREPAAPASLVLVDAVDGTVVEHLTEDNPEDDWGDD